MGPFRNAARFGLECLRGVQLKAWSARCSCLLCVNVVSKHCGQAGHNAHTCPVLLADREQQQEQQNILKPASAKPAPAQRRAHHYSVCGAERYAHAHTHGRARVHGQAYRHTSTYTPTHAHTHARTHCTDSVS